MSKEFLPTPTCELSGLPLPILSSDLPETEGRFTYRDYHHHFHPRRDEALADLGGRALRFSRGQYLPRFLHNRYHTLFAGPPLPTDDTEKYRLTVLACSGIVPRQAIDVRTKGEYAIRDLSPDEHQRLAHHRSIYVERAFRPKGDMYVRRNIADFFAAFAISQQVRDVISEKVTGEFLDKKTTPERKKELGNFILREAIDMSIDDIEPVHETARREGLISQRKQLPLLKVVRTFLTNDRLPTHYSELEMALQ